MEILKMGLDDLLKIKTDEIRAFLTPQEVVHMAKLLGAFWTYDYDVAQKGKVGMHAILKSGRHSDGFFASRILLAPENVRLIICSQIALMINRLYTKEEGPTCLAGVPDGATIIGENVASILNINVLKMEKQGGKITLMSQLGPGERILLVEDICTLGTGFSEAVLAIKSVQPQVYFIPADPVIINRGGLERFSVEGVGEFEVLPVINWKVQDWAANDCPLCELGSKPIKPKETDENWQAITTSQL